MARRKTADERRQEQADAERRAWERFRPKLAALQTFQDAETLLGQAPPHGDPGRPFYSNLGFFIQSFDVPGGSSDTERALYLQFVERLDAAGALKPGARDRVERLLRATIRAFD